MAEKVDKRPKLIVFDLDQTLWPFWVDTNVTLPVSKLGDGDIIDHSGLRIDCYPEVRKILLDLHQNGFILAVASGTTEVKGAQRLLELFELKTFFSYIEIFPDQKTNHLSKIQQNSGVNFREMLFFDDEEKHIMSGTQLGIISILVKNGVTAQLIQDSLSKFAKERS